MSSSITPNLTPQMLRYRRNTRVKLNIETTINTTVETDQFTLSLSLSLYAQFNHCQLLSLYYAFRSHGCWATVLRRCRHRHQNRSRSYPDQDVLFGKLNRLTKNSALRHNKCIKILECRPNEQSFKKFIL